MKKTKVSLVIGSLLLCFSLGASGESLSGKESKRLVGVVNLNTATVEELTLLPGIGSSKAEAIVAYRTAHPLKGVDELGEVKGIGPGLQERLTPYLAVTGETTLKRVEVPVEKPAVSPPGKK